MQALQSAFGPYLSDNMWVPAPRYALRRASILDAMKNKERGEILEVGCATGALLSEFADCGFKATGVEMSKEGRRCADIFSTGSRDMTVLESPRADWREHFAYLFSFEVLEHIEDDLEALSLWVDWVKPGGTAVLSVPAHMKLWGATDEYAGHYRRYSKQQLHDLMAQAGLVDISIEAYGFPVSNIIEPFRNAHHKRRLKQGVADLGMKEATENSGVDRGLESRLFPLMTSFPGRQLLELGTKIQRLFRNTELGTGWVATGRKPDARA